jgi:hypothetical protein
LVFMASLSFALISYTSIDLRFAPARSLVDQPAKKPCVGICKNDDFGKQGARA